MSSRNDVVTATLAMINNMSSDERQELIRLIDTDVSKFAEICFPHIMVENLENPEDVKGFLTGTLQREVYMPKYQQEMYKNYSDLFADVIDYIANILFRGAAKTTLKDIAVSNAICFGKYEVIVLINETVEQASKDMEAIYNELMNNVILKRIFGKIEARINNAKMKVFYLPILKKEVAVFATGMGGRIRGIHYKQKRPQLVLVDDFESETNSDTVEGRDKVQRTIGSKIMNMCDSNYKMVFQGTIIHHEAFLPSVKDLKMFNGNRGRYMEKSISDSPSIKLNASTNRRVVINKLDFKIGELAWPARYPEHKIAEKLDFFNKSRGGAGLWQFFQELYNVPKSDTHVVFMPEKILPVKAKFYRHENITYLDFYERDEKSRLVPILVVSGLDPAAGRQLINDNTVQIVLAITPEREFIVLDVYVDKVGFLEQAEAVFKARKDFNVYRSVVESFGYQFTLYDHIRTENAKRNAGLSLWKYNRTNVSKSNKLKEGLEPVINTGKLSYLEGCRNIDLFLAEVAGFTLSDVHDDTLDALYLCVYGTGNIKPNKIDVNDAIRQQKKTTSVFAKFEANKQKRFSDSWIHN